jgi:hypothetical protein
MTNNLSEDGRHVFFDSADDIIRADVNGKRDVYEYVDGSLHLVSTGTSRFDATFRDANPSGSDVLFSTAEKLVPQDTDGHVDLYDARVGGGFPAPPPPPTPCENDACQGRALPQPAAPPAATVTFFGLGNLPEAAGASTAKVKVTKPKSVRGSVATLHVKVPGKGTVTVSGSGLRKVKKSTSKAQTVSVKVALTKNAVASLRKHRRFTAKARIAFARTGGGTSTATVSLKFTRPKSSTKGRS